MSINPPESTMNLSLRPAVDRVRRHRAPAVPIQPVSVVGVMLVSVDGAPPGAPVS